MANVDAPFGFRPVRHYFGGLIRANRYQIASEYNTSLFTGDPVKGTGTTKQIEIAVTSTNATGVFAGCRYVTPAGDIVYSRYWPASFAVKSGTVVDAYVWDDPFILFEVQADGAVAAADIGTTADFVSGTGNTMTGTSAYELESSGIGSDAGLKIVDYVRDGVNELGTNTRVLVLWNEHEHNTGTLTAV